MRVEPMTDAQYTMLRTIFVGDRFADYLGKMFVAALQEQVKSQENAWDAIYDQLKADRKEDNVVINWVASTFTITTRDEHPVEERVGKRNDAIDDLITAIVYAIGKTLGNSTFITLPVELVEPEKKRE